jgi:Flp pilus assembly protein TadG
MTRQSRRDDRGAVAILTSILAVVLLTVAAMSVDLGNAWARQRDVQTQADLAATSAGHWLPQTAANKNDILTEVADYLNRANNKVVGQNVVTIGQLDDDDLANGEVDFSNGGLRMQVVAPHATVDFGLAAAIGYTSTNVNADATVELQSLYPPLQDVFPFALPSGCPYGPGMADTDSGSPTTDPDFAPSNGQTGDHTISSLTSTPSTVNQGTQPVTLSFTAGNLPNNSSGGTLEFRRGSSTVESYPVTWTQTTADNQSRPVSVTITDTRVTGTAGTWKVWLVLNKHSAASVDFTVAGYTPPTSVGCSSSVSGNFGQLDSPGWSVGQRPQRFAHNIARGLDHLPVPFPTATSDVCASNSGGSIIAGGQLDDVSRANNNCLNIDTGNDGPWVMNGLVTGIDGHKGRLDASLGHTKSGCGSDIDINGTMVNNDRLHCYLRNGGTLGGITNPDDTQVQEAWVDPAITKSPRFVWIPVLRSVNRINDKWQPIKTFVPGMITGEVVTGPTNPADADGDGLVWSGNKVTSIQVFTFNPAVLPLDERSPSGAYNPALRSIPRLVD